MIRHVGRRRRRRHRPDDAVRLRRRAAVPAADRRRLGGVDDGSTAYMADLTDRRRSTASRSWASSRPCSPPRGSSARRSAAIWPSSGARAMRFTSPPSASALQHRLLAPAETLRGGAANTAGRPMAAAIASRHCRRRAAATRCGRCRRTPTCRLSRRSPLDGARAGLLHVGGALHARHVFDAGAADLGFMFSLIGAAHVVGLPLGSWPARASRSDVIVGGLLISKLACRDRRRRQRASFLVMCVQPLGRVHQPRARRVHGGGAAEGGARPGDGDHADVLRRRRPRRAGCAGRLPTRRAAAPPSARRPSP